MNNERVLLERIDPVLSVSSYLGPRQHPEVHKLPFDIHYELPFFDTTYMSDPTKARKKTLG